MVTCSGTPWRWIALVRKRLAARSRGRAEKVNRLAMFIHGTIEIVPRVFHNDCRCSLRRSNRENQLWHWNNLLSHPRRSIPVWPACSCSHATSAYRPDPHQLHHEFGVSAQAFGDTEILRAAKRLGLKMGKRPATWARITTLRLPAIAQYKDGQYVILARVRETKPWSMIHGRRNRRCSKNRPLQRNSMAPLSCARRGPACKSAWRPVRLYLVPPRHFKIPQAPQRGRGGLVSCLLLVC